MTAERVQPGAMLAIAVIAFAMVAGTSALAAQMVAGRVIDARTRARLDSVHVILVADGSGAHVDSVHTDTTGAFYLNAPAAGAFRLEFSKSWRENWTVARFVVGAGEAFERLFVVPPDIDLSYAERKVDRPVGTGRGLASPKYPPRLRAGGFEGGCVVEFDVDTLGRADTATFRVVQQSATEFCDAVREALPKMEFVPAELRGVKVRQLVKQPFTFLILK